MNSRPGKATPNVVKRRWVLPTAAPVGLVLVLALILRAQSLDSFGVQFDENISRAVVENIWHGDLTNNWAHASVTDQFRIDCYNFSSYLYADSAFVGLIKFAARLLSRPFEYTVFWDRVFSLILGTCTVYLSYLLALRLYGRHVAIAAALLIAAIPLLVQDSHYGRPEAFAAFLTALAYLASLRAAVGVRFLVLASLCFGLLIACKISMIPMAVIPLVCLWSQNRLTLRTAGISIGSTILGCFLGVPNAFFHPLAFWNGVEFLRRQYSGVHAPYGLANGSITISLAMQYLWQTMGPIFCLIAVLGMVAMLRKRQYRNFALLAAPVLFYFAYFSLQHVFFERNLSHVAPLLAICFAAGLAWLSDLVPSRRLRAYTFSGLLLLALAPPLRTSGNLVFVAMPTTTEQRARDYERDLTNRVGVPIGVYAHLLNTGMVDHFTHQAAGSSVAVLVRILDYHDSYTRTHLEDLIARTGARQVGYFPSLFHGFSVNTMVTYHSPALRYVLLPPAERRFPGHFILVPWLRAGQPIPPDRVELGSWVENGAFPAAGLPPMADRFFGSYTAAGDANHGAIRLGNFSVKGLDEIGIPVVTGPVSARLSILVIDHATGGQVAEMTPTPTLTEWSLWRVDLKPAHPSQIDIVAKDEGDLWGEWLAVGLPLHLKL